MATVVMMLCLIVPPLLMWWMVKVQRRVREQMRARPREEADEAAVPYVDVEQRTDGLAYGRMTPGAALPPAGLTPEIDGIQALHGRR
ncbi:MAG TPA: hypothetical protein VGB08_05210 [Allosphingosinicella sp.]|jgi:hypothetical protein